jgi:hypothetical protein
MWSIRTPTGGTLAHGAKVMGLAKYCTLKTGNMPMWLHKNKLRN